MTTTPTSTPSPSPDGSRAKGILLFATLAFLPAWALEGLIALSGGLGTPTSLALLVLSMFVPGLASVVTRTVTREGWSNAGLRVGRLTYYPAAWALILALVGATGLITWAIWPDSLDLTQLHQFERLPLLWPVLAALAVLLGPIINSLPAFGEELGWRGYLLPKLLFLGELRACLASGAIWGLWHAPVIVQGYNFPRHPLAGVLIMTVGCALLGTILGWLRLRSGSVFTATLAHGTLNAAAGMPLLLMPGIDTAYGGLLLGTAGWLPMLLTVLVLLGTGRLAGARVQSVEA